MEMLQIRIFKMDYPNLSKIKIQNFYSYPRRKIKFYGFITPQRTRPFTVKLITQLFGLIKLQKSFSGNCLQDKFF
jgi:hypothetical protein